MKRNEHSVVEGVEGKACTTCKSWTPLSHFTKRARAWDGHHHQCRTCSREAIRWSHLRRSYGVTREVYEKMFAEQGGVCAICGESCGTGHRLCVDHDHETSEVRQLLCKRCNSVLGLVAENPELLEAMGAYLNDHLGKRIRN